MLSRLDDALRSVGEGTAEIVAERLHQGISRFAGAQIHQTTELDDVQVWVRVALGQRLGEAAGSSLDPRALRTLVGEATSRARTSQPTPTFRSFADPEPVPDVPGYDAATAEMGAGARADSIGRILASVRERGWTASGTYLTEGRYLAVANSQGVRTFAPSSTAFLRALPDSGRGTGYASELAWRAADLDAGDIATRALWTCERNVDQRDVRPGTYEAILGPEAVAEALLYMGRSAFAGQGYEEGSGFFSGRLGERVTGANVTIWDDATDGRNLAVATDYEGVPKRGVPLITEGVATGVVYNTELAQRYGRQTTGHAGDPNRTLYGAVPANLFMAGGDASREEMIRHTKRGLLITRFHYTHGPDPKRVVMTGTTRDGTFLIENGEIVGAVKNMRLTQSVPELLSGIEMLGEPVLCRDWWCSNGMGRMSYVCPPIKVSAATFTSGTLF